MKLGLALALLALLAAPILALHSPTVARENTQLYYTGFSPTMIERVGNEYRIVYRILLASPAKSSFSIYYKNGKAPASVYVSVKGENTTITVAPRERSRVATIVLAGKGWVPVKIEVYTPVFLAGYSSLSVAASPARSPDWIPRFLLVSIAEILALLVVVTRLLGRWTSTWLPGYAGVFLLDAFSIYHGIPRPYVLDSLGTAYSYYISVSLQVREISLIAGLLAVMLGSLAAYYPRGGGWEEGEILLGSWGPRRIAGRLVLALAATAISYIAAFTAILYSEGILGILHATGSLSAFYLFVARDTVCIALIFLGVSLLASSLSLLTRSPLFVLIAGVLVFVLLVHPPCTIGVGGVSTASYGGVSQVSYRYGFDRLWHAARWSITLAIPGLLLHGIAWAKR